MAGNAGGLCRGFAGWTDSSSYSQQRRPLEFWAIHFFEHSQGHGSFAAKSRTVLGDGAAGHLRGAGSGPRGACARNQAEMAFRDSRALGLVASARGDRHVDVRGITAENLEQHAQRDEPRTTPAASAEGPHGRAVAADQSALSLQHAEYRDGSDSL